MHAGPPDLPDLAPLPPDIRAVVERQMAALAAERAARLHLESENEELKAHNTRLQHLVRELERADLSGISCVGGHDGSKGAPTCHDAKSPRYPMPCSTSY